MSRAKWKGPYVNKTSHFKNSELYRTPALPRSFEITSKIVGSTFNVYTGQKFIAISITDDMIGHKIGEFCPTREKFVFKKKKKKKK
jgi:small subunit ribosomal protein S19